MKNMSKLKLYGLGIIILFHTGCADNFLDIKSSMSIESPSTIEDFQALLDDAAMTMNSQPPISLSFIAGEEYWISSDVWHAVPITNNRIQQKNAYIWKKDVYEGEPGADWNSGYRKILYANIVLKGVGNITPETEETSAWNNLKGSALFFRAWNHYLLAHQFCKVYDPSTASDEPGLPLRLDPDVTLVSRRVSLEQTYMQIVEDLLSAELLLPDHPVAKTRPSRLAVQLLLAKVYMDMEQYNEALESIHAMGDLSPFLLDYNTLSKTNNFPFPTDYGATNPEMLFLCYMNTPTIMNTSRMNVNEELLEMYEDEDLRGDLFYTVHAQGNVYYRGSYMGGTPVFLGLSSPEALLIRAECYARLGEYEKASLDIHKLKLLRYNKDAEIHNPKFQSEKTAIQTIYNERRKELAFKGNHWRDLRRFNKEMVFSREMTRVIDEKPITLSPGDDRFIWQIPQEVIQLSGIEQN